MNTWDNGFRGKPGQGMSHTLSFGGAASFFRVPYQTDMTGVDVAVTGVPLDIATTNRPGARLGPRAIRNASLSLAWERPWPWHTDPMAALRVIDYGDCEPADGDLLSVSHIEKHIASIVDAGAAALVLGGDHFIAYPSLRAHAAAYGPLSLIHFDAHTDTWPSSGNGINHGTMFYQAALEKIVNPATSTQIGIRTTNDDTLGFHIVSAADAHQIPGRDIAKQIRERVGNSPVYITFDIDCLDPAFAPGTGTPVPGGLSTFQALNIIRELKGINLVGMDVVEVAPAYDHAEITALAAAQIAIELLCLYAENHQQRR
ncbi:agmatinase [Nitrosomonas sp. Nm84]|uniref:agmatinase n=1 Tax=Nitrosomonas sp. Nm84 TaxID=200124 RepID=UPI000D76C99D|nr:agmatinase [Nitrosomonas sp. Nm84]PXW88366.1 agmatinase [Nitrosomonas sp. Nm84]